MMRLSFWGPALATLLTVTGCNTGPSKEEQRSAQENAYSKGLVEGRSQAEKPETTYVQPAKDQVTLSNTSPSTAPDATIWQ